MNVLLFANISSPEIELFNKLHDYFSSKKATLYLILFTNYDADLNLLKSNYLFLGGHKFELLKIPCYYKNKIDPWIENQIQHFYQREQHLNPGNEVNSEYFQEKINSFYFMVK